MTVFQYFPFLLRVEPQDVLVPFEPGHLLTGIDAGVLLYFPDGKG